MMLSKSQNLARVLLSSSKPKPMVDFILKATICHKSLLPEKNHKKWPYEKKAFYWHNFWLDPMTEKKFDENSKIVLIEGNVASGKEDFGRRLANELGMHYMPDIDLDKYYINDYGYDLRALNPLLPERLRFCDWEMFHENPSRHSVIHMQRYLFVLRTYQYIKALRHLFNTGQGVVLNRSCFSERVFIEAMHNLGWLPHGYLRGDGLRFYDYKNLYNYIRGMVLFPLYKPHLTIYLETPVDVCMERIRSSDNPMIAESKALIPEFLTEIERAYDDIMLQKLSNNGLVFKVKYPERFTDEEIMDVVDDLSNLDFTYDPRDTRFDDWDKGDSNYWYFLSRIKFTNSDILDEVFKYMNIGEYDIAGLGDSITALDIEHRKSLLEAHLRPVGFFTRFNTDLRFNNPIKAILDIRNFDERCQGYIRINHS